MSPSRSISSSISSSVSPSSSPSISISSSISSSPSISISSSISRSISSSISLSPSSSISSSVSPSSSVSSSISGSISSSVSPSSSISTSPSSSPSAGYADYTRGEYTVVPTTDDDLSTNYTTQDYIDVSTINSITVAQSATSAYAIHQFKNNVLGASSCTLEWRGQTNIPTTLKNVRLQIFNRNTNLWETLTGNNTSPANTYFTLTASIVDLTEYKDDNSVISCRVYQLDL